MPVFHFHRTRSCLRTLGALPRPTILHRPRPVSRPRRLPRYLACHAGHAPVPGARARHHVIRHVCRQPANHEGQRPQVLPFLPIRVFTVTRRPLLRRPPPAHLRQCLPPSSPLLQHPSPSLPSPKRHRLSNRRQPFLPLSQRRSR